HLFYISPDGPVYAYRDAGGWHASAFDSAVTVGTLQLDRAGRPCVAYLVPGTRRVRFARYTGSAWHHERVDDAGGAVQPWLAFDGVGEPRIAYTSGSPYVGTAQLWYATSTLGGWTVEEVPGVGGSAGAASHAIGGGDSPCCAYLV